MLPFITTDYEPRHSFDMTPSNWTMVSQGRMIWAVAKICRNHLHKWCYGLPPITDKAKITAQRWQALPVHHEQALPTLQLANPAICRHFGCRRCCVSITAAHKRRPRNRPYRFGCAEVLWQRTHQKIFYSHRALCWLGVDWIYQKKKSTAEQTVWATATHMQTQFASHLNQLS